MSTNGTRKPTKEEMDRFHKRLMREKGPSTEGASSRFVNWDDLRDWIGQPFDQTRIPLSKLHQMRRDPMIAFGLLFCKVPLIRARWYIESKDARVAAFVDNALRRIYARFIFGYTNALDFGFSAMEKRFELLRPDWEYGNPENTDQKPKKVWTENVDALVWKAFMPLPPDDVDPFWTDDGEFGGIIFRQVPATSIESALAPKAKPQPDIPLEKALWATNEKDSVFGSVWGYPRTAYAYRYWWSYWFRWALADRHFEKDADPATQVYYPAEVGIDADGNEVDYRTLALQIGENARSGSTIALPSETITGFDDKPTNMRKWQIEYLQGGGNFQAFDDNFRYLDVAKLRAIMVPEQAFLEGSGGTSSRNVAETLGDVFYESQAVLMAEIDEHINRFIIPQLVEANFGPGITARKVTRGFTPQDTDLARQIIALIGQADPSALEVDIRETLDNFNIPLMTPQEIAREEKKLEEEAAKQKPEPMGQPGASANGYAGVNQWGFYEDSPEVIHLTTKPWIPDSPHFEEDEIKDYATEIRDDWRDIYREWYDEAAEVIAKASPETLTLSDGQLNLAVGGKFVDWVLKHWLRTDKQLEQATNRVAGFVRSIMDAAGRKEIGRLRITDAQWDMDNPEVVQWANTHAADLVKNVTETTRAELRRFLTKELGKTQTPTDIAAKVRDHFAQFPDWKAERLARTEAMMAYNAGALHAWKQNGVNKVQALDAANPLQSDPDCIDRDGKTFTIEQAFIEQAKEHPNGTLAWAPLSEAELTITFSDEPLQNDALAIFDPETETVTFSLDCDLPTAEIFVKDLSDRLNFGPWGRLVRTIRKQWKESNVRRAPAGSSTGGRFVNKPDVIKPTPPPKTKLRDVKEQVQRTTSERYQKKSKTLDVQYQTKAEKAAKKGRESKALKNEGVSSYLREDPDFGFTPQGHLNQKRLLKFAYDACPDKHPPDAENPEDVILDARTTFAKYATVMPDGTVVWDESRRAIHEKIIDMMLRRRNLDKNGKPDSFALSETNDYLPSQTEPQLFFTGGGYASGKGFLLEMPEMESTLPSDSLTLDPDIIKAYLPEFDQLAEIDPSINLALYEEAWEIGKAVQAEAAKRRINIIVDGITDTAADEVLARVDFFRKNGYTAQGAGMMDDGKPFDARISYITVPTEEALRRAQGRAENIHAKKKDRRMIPTIIERIVHRDVSATVPELIAEAGKNRLKIEIYDNEAFSDPPPPDWKGTDDEWAKQSKGDKWTHWSVPTLIAETDGSGNLIIHYPELYQQFLDKAHEDIGITDESRKEKLSRKAKAAAKTAAIQTGGTLLAEDKDEESSSEDTSEDEVEDAAETDDDEPVKEWTVEDIYKAGMMPDLPYESGDPNPQPLQYRNMEQIPQSQGEIEDQQ